MTIQQLILNRLPEDVRKSLIELQLKEANEILSGIKKKIKSYVISTVRIESIIPTQIGEDYNNSSSQQDAKDYKAVKLGEKGIEEVRVHSFRPIVVDKDTNEIIDGNHRHYATKAIGEHFIYALLCEVESQNNFKS